MHGIECCIILFFLFLKLFSFKHCVFAFICTSVKKKTKKKTECACPVAYGDIHIYKYINI